MRTLRTLAADAGRRRPPSAVPSSPTSISLAFAARIGWRLGDALLRTPSSPARRSSARRAGSLALVLAAPIADTLGSASALAEPAPGRSVSRAMLLVLPPTLGAIALDRAYRRSSWCSSSSLSHADAVAIVGVMLALSGTMLASAVEPVPMLAAFATSRYARVAIQALTMVAIQIAAAAIALAADSLVGLGLAASFGSLVYVLLLLRLIWGARIGAPLAVVARAAGAAAAPAARCSSPPASPPTRSAASCGRCATFVASLLYVLFLRLRRPQHWALLLRLTPGAAPAPPATPATP